MMNQTMKTIIERRSVRHFMPDQIPDEMLQQVLTAGTLAPSSMNSQSWHFTVLQKPELREEISAAVREKILASNNERLVAIAQSDNYHCFYKAPTVIIVSGDMAVLNAAVNCANATMNMALAAWSMQIGSCYTSSLTIVMNDEELGPKYKQAVGIPAGFNVEFALCLGFPKEGADEKRPSQRREGTINWVR